MSLTSREAALMDRVARSVDGSRFTFSELSDDEKDIARALLKTKLLRREWDGAYLTITPAGRHALDEYQGEQRKYEDEHARQLEQRLAEAVRSQQQHEQNIRSNHISSIIGAIVNAVVSAILSLIKRR